MFRAAVTVICQGLNNPAVADPAMPALIDHPGQFPLERLQTGYPAIDLRQVTSGDAVGPVAGSLRLRCHRKQRPDVLDLKPQFAGMPDEVEPVSLGLAVAALIAFRTRRLRQQTDLFVEADRRHLHAGSLRQLANRKIHLNTS